MTGKILVAYASRFGTTAGVAEAIGKTLAEHGAEVLECHPRLGSRPAAITESLMRSHSA